MSATRSRPTDSNESTTRRYRHKRAASRSRAERVYFLSDQIAYLQEWLDVNAHTGRYQVDGDTLVWYRDISENPNEVGTVSRLAFEQREDQLVLSFTLPNGDRYEWVWQRLK